MRALRGSSQSWCSHAGVFTSLGWLSLFSWLRGCEQTALQEHETPLFIHQGGAVGGRHDFFLLTASVNETFDAGCEISCFFFFFKSNEFLLELREQKLCCTETTVNCLWSTNQNLSVYLIQKPPHHHPFYPPAVCKYNEEQSSETVFQFLYSSQVNHLDHLFAESLAKLIISYLTWPVTQTQTEPGLTDQLKAFRSLFPFFVGKRIQQCRALMA